VCHGTFGIGLHGLLERTNARAVIEAVKESEALIEIPLSFWRIGRDLARIRSEPLVERFFGCAEIESGRG
jgi:hypothetical protein